MKPFLKWAGGKTRLLPELLKYVPKQYGRYVDPFMGGGALFFHLQPENVIVADANRFLCDTYRGVQYEHDITVRLLERFAKEHSEDRYRSAVDEMQKVLTFGALAAYFIYINKTSFNGLYRVNKNGQYNVPIGKQKKIDLYCGDNLRDVHLYLVSAAIIHIHCCDFRETLKRARPGDFIYADPPYHGGFTAYTAKGFTEQDHTDLARICADLAGKGCHILASNSNTDFIKQLWGQYGCFDIHEVEAPRSISCKGSGRGKVKELIITNVWNC
ncbi:modification methylase [Candidatus Magnetobacterium bavaricum]|uniref:Site-specific DNA-methyltransferase (adenine-specific) n=1 Tax=Candidatus Magnetobacterium bavaricum TaxID=29290 RepID=A0A0F3GTB8_9BACT|nr:modification methylase [Candidatus Magnetobacterium bavaricum]